MPSQPRHRPRDRFRSAATAVLFAAVLWVAVGEHVVHPMFHRGSGTADCCGGSSPPGGWLDARCAHGHAPDGAAISGPCPVCLSLALGQGSYLAVASPAIVPPLFPAFRRLPPADVHSRRTEDLRRARAPPVAC